MTLMRVYFFLLFISTSTLIQLNAQDRTGVWRGIITVARAALSTSYNSAPINSSKENSKKKKYSRVDSASVKINQENTTQAKLELIEVKDRIFAQLTSYGPDNTLVTMYEFYGRPTPKEFYQYHFQGKSVLINETNKRADLFDLRLAFHTLDSSLRLYGAWDHPFVDRRFGYLSFKKVNEPITINPELLKTFYSKNGIKDEEIDIVNFSYPVPIHDTLVTDAIALYGNLVDNGTIDQDTLSIWLNGKMLDDNVIPGKKPFFFRANLSDQEWNHFTIRCKSEGKEKGAGVHLNLQLNDVQMKYNLVLYQYHQADWIIRRPEKPKLGVN